MKKYIAIIMIMALMFSLCACAGGPKEAEIDKQPQENAEAVEPAVGEPVEVPEDASGDISPEKSGKTNAAAELDQNSEDGEDEVADVPQQKYGDAAEGAEDIQLPDEIGKDAETQDPEYVPSPENIIAQIMELIGHPVEELIELAGEPISKDYAPSCLGPGEDGEWTYDGFVVYTYREGDVETIEDVELV